MSTNDPREHKPEIEYLTPRTAQQELPPLPPWQDHEDLVLNGHIDLSSSKTTSGETLH